MLPDELQHEQLVEIRIEQRPRDGIELPVVVVRAPGQIDDHTCNFTRPHRSAAAIPAAHVGQLRHGSRLRSHPRAPPIPRLIQRGKAGAAQQVVRHSRGKRVSCADRVGHLHRHAPDARATHPASPAGCRVRRASPPPSSAWETRSAAVCAPAFSESCAPLSAPSRFGQTQQIQHQRNLGVIHLHHRGQFQRLLNHLAGIKRRAQVHVEHAHALRPTSAPPASGSSAATSTAAPASQSRWRPRAPPVAPIRRKAPENPTPPAREWCSSAGLS